MLRRLPFALIPVMALVLVLESVQLPYYAEGPGPARDVEPLIDVSGHRVYGSAGHLILTAVDFSTVNAFTAVGAWLDPARDLIPKSYLIFPGETEQQADQRAVSQMDQSKIDAAFVVLSRITSYPKDHGPGALVEGVASDCAAAGKLFPGDLIVSIDGQVVKGLPDVRRDIASVKPGATAHLVITAGGQRTKVAVVPSPCEGSKRLEVGFSAVPNFPFHLRISSADIGGPSAGLMWALGLYDLLTPGDLTRGRTIAGTGEIHVDGSVNPIGGVRLKIAAAKRAGAGVFLLPKQNLEEAKAVASGIRLVPVTSFREALDYLKGHS